MALLLVCLNGVQLQRPEKEKVFDSFFTVVEVNRHRCILVGIISCCETLIILHSNPGQCTYILGGAGAQA